MMNTDDPELTAMTVLVQALEPLTEDVRRRVLEYVLKRYASVQNIALPPLDDRDVGGDEMGTNKRLTKPRKQSRRVKVGARTSSNPVDLTKLVNWIKSSDQFEVIDNLALRGKDNVAKVLIALLAFKKSQHEGSGLTSGDVFRLYRQLNVKTHQSDLSRALSEKGKQFVITDDLRLPGQPVRYRLSHQGESKVSEMLSDELLFL
jgi:hypothetical protein